MLCKLRNGIGRDEAGFTLIELLVVILIIGILAAIALPAFLGQRAKGQDGEAKSNARNLVSHIESCFTQKQDYQQCVTAAALNPTGLAIGSAGGEVEATANGVNGYAVVATSKSNNTFTITKNPTTGALSRSCSTGGGGTTNGGCDGSAW